MPVNSSGLGESIKPTEPVIKQIFIQRGLDAGAPGDGDAFERRLFIVRKEISNAVLALNDPRAKGFYTVSLSSRTSSTRACCSRPSSANISRTCRTHCSKSALALVHQRFSTNTFPTWQLAHPYRHGRP